jgi:hypothetical protein
MSADVYLIDSRAYSLVQPPEQRGNRIASIVVGRKETPERCAKWVLHYLLPGEHISLLRVLAHGDAGGVELGTGLDPNTAKGWGCLHGRFHHSGLIELHACGVASATSIITEYGPNMEGKKTKDGTYDPRGMGVTFLKILAKTTHCRVRAAINRQDMRSHSGYYWRFEGPTVLCVP